MRQHKSKKCIRQAHNKKHTKTENYKIDSKRTLQQYTQKTEIGKLSTSN